MLKEKNKIIQENLFLKEGDTFEIGNIKYNDTTLISFYLDNYKGLRYANIRNIVISKRFSGPTKKGIKLNKAELTEIVELSENLNFELENLEERILGSFRRTNSENREIRVSINLYNGKYGYDIREMYKDKKGEFKFGKGIRIKIEYAEQAIVLLNKMNDKFDIKFDEHSIDNMNVNTKDNHKEKSEKKDTIKISEGIPEDLTKYF